MILYFSGTGSILDGLGIQSKQQSLFYIYSRAGDPIWKTNGKSKQILSGRKIE